MFEKAKKAGRKLKKFGKNYYFTASYAVGSLIGTTIAAASTGSFSYLPISLIAIGSYFTFNYELKRNVRRELEEKYPLEIHLLLAGKYKEAEYAAGLRRVRDTLKSLDDMEKS